MSDHCDACPVRDLGWTCAARSTGHVRYCENMARNPGRWRETVIAATHRTLHARYPVPEHAAPPAWRANLAVLRRARHCPHRRPCGCATFECAIGRGTLLDGRATLDDCKACPIARGLILEPPQPFR